MTSKIKLQIAEPCHENWNDMTAAEQGRFCQACEKTVTDFTNMTDKEILDYLAQSNGQICGRASNDQLNRVLNPEPKRRYVWAYAMNIALAGVLSIAEAGAQTKPANKNKTEQSEDKARGEIEVDVVLPRKMKLVSGVVVDSKTNQPIPFASVRVKGTSSGVTSDANGKFSINIMFQKSEVVLIVSVVGYKEQEYTVNVNSGEVRFFLDQEANMLDSVFVSGNPNLLNQVTVGMIIMREEPSFTDKVKRNIDVLLPDAIKSKAIKVYPNPIVAGNNFYISVSVKEKGIYTVDIISTDGRLMQSQKLSVNADDQQISIGTSAQWAAGTYWLKLTNEISKKNYQTQLVVN